MELNQRPANLVSGSIEELDWATKESSLLRKHFMSEYMKNPLWEASPEFETYSQEVNGIISRYYKDKIVHHRDVTMLELQTLTKALE